MQRTIRVSRPDQTLATQDRIYETLDLPRLLGEGWHQAWTEWLDRTSVGWVVMPSEESVLLAFHALQIRHKLNEPMRAVRCTDIAAGNRPRWNRICNRLQKEATDFMDARDSTDWAFDMAVAESTNLQEPDEADVEAFRVFCGEIILVTEAQGWAAMMLDVEIY